MNESRIDKSEKPEICSGCRFHDFNCAVSETLDPNAERCALFAAPVPDNPSRCTVSWPTGQGQRRFFVHYPNGSVVTGTITMTMDEAR